MSMPVSCIVLPPPNNAVCPIFLGFHYAPFVLNLLIFKLCFDIWTIPHKYDSHHFFFLNLTKATDLNQVKAHNRLTLTDVSINTCMATFVCKKGEKQGQKVFIYMSSGWILKSFSQLCARVYLQRSRFVHCVYADTLLYFEFISVISHLVSSLPQYPGFWKYLSISQR